MVTLMFGALPLCAQGNVPQRPQVVTVAGQVKKPGIIEYIPRMPIVAAIFAAGGTTDFGTLRRVKVTRNGKQLQLDLTDKKTRNEEFAEAGDVIEVPVKIMLGK